MYRCRPGTGMDKDTLGRMGWRGRLMTGQYVTEKNFTVHVRLGSSQVTAKWSKTKHPIHCITVLQKGIQLYLAPCTEDQGATSYAIMSMS